MTRRSPAAQFWYSLLWCLCWVFCRVWFRYRFTGRDRVPKTGSVLLVANHQSHLDPVLVGVACPRQMSALARSSLFFWPLGWLIRSLGAVPIERGGGGMAGFKATLKLLRQGETVLVFPEGTRTRDGRLQPFQNGFCALARRGAAAIVPVAITGAYEAMPRGRAIPNPTRISLRFCKPISSEQVSTLSDDQLAGLVRSEIARANRQEEETG